MTYLAIVDVQNNRISKFQPFGTMAEADAHVSRHGGTVFHNVNDWNPLYLQVVGSAVTELTPTGSSPRSLTARQFRLGLVNIAGRSLAQVDSAIAAIADPAERATAEIEWLYATKFERDHALIASLSGALGLTAEQVDGFWQQALSL